MNGYGPRFVARNVAKFCVPVPAGAAYDAGEKSGAPLSRSTRVSVAPPAGVFHCAVRVPVVNEPPLVVEQVGAENAV